MPSGRKDYLLVAAIGALVGILSQPVLSNVLPEISVMFRMGAFLGFSALAPLALFAAALAARIVPVAYQFAKFAAVGTLNSFIDAGILNVLIMAIPQAVTGPWYAVAKGISFLAATTNSYLWNRTWTFQAGNNATTSEAGKFYIVAVIGWMVNVSVASFVVIAVPIPPALNEKIWANVGLLAGIFSSLLWNFLWYKFFVFRKK